MEERFKGHPVLIDERNALQPLLMGVADFVLEAGCQCRDRQGHGVLADCPWVGVAHIPTRKRGGYRGRRRDL